MHLNCALEMLTCKGVSMFMSQEICGFMTNFLSS